MCILPNLFWRLLYKEIYIWIDIQHNLCKKVEQIICFSQEDSECKIGNREFYLASLGDNVTLNE